MKNNSVPTFVKWAGGKTQLLEQFEPFLPKGINRYFEPFVGSGAVFFYIKQNLKPNFCMISDDNKDLINLYLTVRDNLKELLDLLKNYKNEHMKNPKEFYYQQRDEFNRTQDTLVKSALFVYLNKTCFNGLYRVNSKGEFNVPIGSYKKPSILQQNVLEQASNLLQDVNIKSLGFDKILDFAEAGDFIYFDPPYYPLSNTSSFTSYHKNGFSDKEQKLLAKIFEKLNDRGCLLMLSNSDSQFIHELYSKYEQEGYLYLVKAKRMINCNGNGRNVINEVVVTNYKPRPTATQKSLQIQI